MANIGARKQFAIVLDSMTKEPRRLIDTSGDADDSYLLKAQQNVAADETFVMLALEDYPALKPYAIAATLGYIAPAQAAIAPDPAQIQAAADIAPFIPSLSKQTIAALAAQIKTLYGPDGFTVLPRDDPKTQQILATALPAAMASKLTNDAPEAPFYVAAVVQSLWTQLDPTAKAVIGSIAVGS